MIGHNFFNFQPILIVFSEIIYIDPKYKCVRFQVMRLKNLFFINRPNFCFDKVGMKQKNYSDFAHLRTLLLIWAQKHVWKISSRYVEFKESYRGVGRTDRRTDRRTLWVQ